MVPEDIAAHNLAAERSVPVCQTARNINAPTVTSAPFRAGNRTARKGSKIRPRVANTNGRTKRTHSLAGTASARTPGKTTLLRTRNRSIPTNLTLTTTMVPAVAVATTIILHPLQPTTSLTSTPAACRPVQQVLAKTTGLGQHRGQKLLLTWLSWLL